MPLLEIENVKKKYNVKKFGNKYALLAVNGVSFPVEEGKCVGLVGESGCGKSTLGRLIVGLENPNEGRVLFNGMPVHKKADGKDAKALRFARDTQMVFQDSFDAVNPKFTAKKIIEEPLKNFTDKDAKEREAEIDHLLLHVGLDPMDKNKFAMEFSGGQLQRVCIARALASNPKLFVLDEPLSSLDVSVQAQILNLLDDIKKEMNISYILISHDLEAVYHLSDALVVMYGGQIMERVEDIRDFNNMKHPYTKKLLSSTPAYENESEEDENAEMIWMDIGVQTEGFEGCPYCGRCAHAKDECKNQKPEMKEISSGHFAACHIL